MTDRIATGTVKVSKYGTFNRGGYGQEYFSERLLGHQSPNYYVNTFVGDFVDIVDAKGKLVITMCLSDFNRVDNISGQHEVMSGGWLVDSLRSQAKYIKSGITSLDFEIRQRKTLIARILAAEKGHRGSFIDNSPFYKVDAKKYPRGRMLMLLVLNGMKDFRVIDSKIFYHRTIEYFYFIFN